MRCLHWNIGNISMTYLLECANQVNVTKKLAKSVFQWAHVYTIPNSFSCRHEKQSGIASMNTYPICDPPLKRSTRRILAAFQKSRLNHRSNVWTEALPSIRLSYRRKSYQVYCEQSLKLEAVSLQKFWNLMKTMRNLISFMLYSEGFSITRPCDLKTKSSKFLEWCEKKTEKCSPLGQAKRRRRNWLFFCKLLHFLSTKLIAIIWTDRQTAGYLNKKVTWKQTLIKFR